MFVGLHTHAGMARCSVCTRVGRRGRPYRYCAMGECSNAIVHLSCLHTFRHAIGVLNPKPYALSSPKPIGGKPGVVAPLRSNLCYVVSLQTHVRPGRSLGTSQVQSSVTCGFVTRCSKPFAGGHRNSMFSCSLFKHHVQQVYTYICRHVLFKC